MINTGNIEIGGISIAVEKKQVRNMYIRILPPDGRVRITAPYRTDDALVMKFADDHLSWIIRNRSRYSHYDHKYENGEIFYLWGKPYKLELDYQPSNGVCIIGERLILSVMPDSSITQKKHVIDEWYRTKLRYAVPAVMKRCETEVGRNASSWYVRDMRTRWGTCNTASKRICLNLQLASKPPECLDYVVTHELTHLYVRNHGPEFQKLMDVYYPDWRAVKKRLNSNDEKPSV